MKKGFVHRKGATRAFPAGHPDLKGTVWESTGHPCLIPGSMYDGAAILFPSNNAYASGCSVNHGSGRILARGKAKRQLECRQGEIDNDMKTVKRDFMVDAEPNTAVGIPARIIKDSSNNNHPKRWGLSRQQQVHGIPFIKMQIL